VRLAHPCTALRAAAERRQPLVGIHQVNAAIVAETRSRALERGMTYRLREREHASKDLAKIFPAAKFLVGFGFYFGLFGSLFRAAARGLSTGRRSCPLPPLAATRRSSRVGRLDPRPRWVALL